MRNGNIAALIVCLQGLAGCAHGQPSPLPDSTTASVSTGQPSHRMPDPSVELCLQEGHQLAPVRKAGIVQSYFCINPQTGLKCDSWAYYRGECSLEGQGPRYVDKPPADSAPQPRQRQEPR